MPFQKGVPNLTGGRKSLPQEFQLVANITKFSPKFWSNLHKMIDCKLENTLSPTMIEALSRAFENNPRELKDVIETLSTNAIKQREFAMQEFNKIQVKRIPQDITSGGEKLPTPLLANINAISDNNSHKEDSLLAETH
jgi:hypothetical protein